MVLSTLTHDIIGSLGVGGEPSCVVESPDGTCLYVADHRGSVTVVAIDAVSASSAVDPADGECAAGECRLPERVRL
ncbi:hypothetical protein [Mycobacterium botniense]|nr:hypothetical protein [Mycobacterium botniense]